MYIDTIRLENIRGFRELEFSFDRGEGQYAGWTVLTGDNGSGKSTVLRSMALMLAGPTVALALQPGYAKWVRKDSGQSAIRIGIVRTRGDDEYPALGATWPGEQISLASTVTLWNQGKNFITWRDPYNVTSDSQQASEIAKESLWSAMRQGWFSLGYGPFRRISRSSQDINTLMADPEAGRFATLFQESASLAETDEWLRQLNYKRLEGHAKEGQLLKLVIQFLNDQLLPNQVRVDRVDSDGLWLKDQDGTELSWSDMSDGYRSALALLTDILRHMSGTYGIDGLIDQDQDGRMFIRRSGVVLIDEIDAHLHPEWQREIGFWLKRHFPNIQFIVTSHSPLICQAADPNGLFVLPEPGSDEPARALTPEEYQEVISSRPDTILRSAAFGLQNTRSPVAVEARSAFADLRTKQRAGGKLTKTELVELERLRQYINPDEEP